MHQANIPKKICYRLWTKAFGTATLLDGLIVSEVNGQMMSRNEQFFGVGNNPKFAKHLRTWGEAGVVTTKTKTTPKLNDRGTTCVFVGYSTDHARDCYDMWNPETGKVYQTHDVIWLRHMYYSKPS